MVFRLAELVGGGLTEHCLTIGLGYSKSRDSLKKMAIINADYGHNQRG